MTKFYFVRHGKTEYNVNHFFQGGSVDSPLLAEGIEGAIKAGEYLADIKFDLAAVSTQKRAMDTANYILTSNNHLNGLEVAYLDDLREINFGDLDGTSFLIPEQKKEPYIMNLRHQPDLYDPSPFNGETYPELLKRSTGVIAKLTERYPKGTILVVSHGVTLISLINHLLGKPLSQAREGSPLGNTSVTILENSATNPEAFEMVDFNNVSFLK